MLWYKLPEYDARQKDSCSPVCIHSVSRRTHVHRARPTESQGVLGVSWGLCRVAWMEHTSGSHAGQSKYQARGCSEEAALCSGLRSRTRSSCTGDGIGLLFTQFGYFILAQLLFAYAFDMLLCWSRRDTLRARLRPVSRHLQHQSVPVVQAGLVLSAIRDGGAGLRRKGIDSLE